jgi:FKBP-type peptidyl-prolyl cis-trans isomerase SlyD
LNNLDTSNAPGSHVDQDKATDAANLIALNKVVNFHYKLAEVAPDGSHGDRMEESSGGEPLFYLHGFHNVVVGLERALEGKAVGKSIEITLKPEEAYGPRQPDSVQRVPIKHLQLQQGVTKLKSDMMAAVKTDRGVRSVVVSKVGKFNADFNHPLARRTLYCEIEVVGIRDASAEEIAHGHVHGPGGHHH